MQNVAKTLAACAVIASGVILSAAQVRAQDFSGFFAGLYAASVYTGTEQALGAKLGYDYQMGNLVVGGDVDYFIASLSGDTEFFVNARAGYAVAEDVLLFMTAGRGTYNGSLALWSLGLGAEFNVTDSVSLRTDYEEHNVLGVPMGAGFRFFKLGANWNF